jgi:hypothetical protein
MEIHNLNIELDNIVLSIKSYNNIVYEKMTNIHNSEDRIFQFTELASPTLNYFSETNEKLKLQLLNVIQDNISEKKNIIDITNQTYKTILDSIGEKDKLILYPRKDIFKRTYNSVMQFYEYNVGIKIAVLTFIELYKERYDIRVELDKDDSNFSDPCVDTLILTYGLKRVD